ncbi:HD domain-containing phosphohydrolase [Metabacillus mangrovi]|uniref:HD domain-containing phosphohydrolase n=1 Tax=Metabacillus mangrovi TaxID=1491830 RepID=UPI00139142AD
MRTGLEQLIEGCILSEDVTSRSRDPIMKKDTILNQEMIGVLNAFLIKEAAVKPYLSSGEPFQPGYSIQSRQQSPQESFSDCTSDFRKNAELFHLAFLSWQSGAAVDLPKIREIVLPLAERYKEEPGELLKIPSAFSSQAYVAQHSLAVSMLSAFIANQLGFPQGEVNQIALAGALSDCGMAKMTPAVLQKKLALTDREFAEIKQHSIAGYKMIKEISTIKEGVKVGVLQHHERLDGSGYPLGVKGEQLHPYGKIVAAADTFMAMICPRPYRSPLSPFKVIEEMKQDSFGKFDLSTVDVISKMLARLLRGSHVKLSDGTIGEVIFTDPQHPVRPIIRTNGKEMVQLEKRLDLYIEEIL